MCSKRSKKFSWRWTQTEILVVDLADLENASSEIKDRLGSFLETHDLVELFRILDVDGNRQLDMDEFVEEIARLATSNPPVRAAWIWRVLSAPVYS